MSTPLTTTDDSSAPAALSLDAARRGLYLLTFSRWFPLGLVVGIFMLLATERGLDIAQIAVIFSIQGFTVLALELPTGGLADALGRRRVQVAAAALQVLSAVVLALAHSFWAFAAGVLVMGVFRALDSGPVEAWFVDASHAADPEAEIEGPLSRAGLVLGLSIAGGALASAGLIAWHPFAATLTALEVPVWAWTALTVANVVVVALVMKEPHRAGADAPRVLASAREAPRVVAGGVRLLGRSRVLRALVLVEVFWAVGMIGFEAFMPLRLGELLASETQAGVWMGPASAAAWGLFAVGAELAGRIARRVGATRVAMGSRALNGLAVVAMGLVAGPGGLLAAFLVAYALHGANGPMHNVLLHREAAPQNRTLVLSMNSMAASASFALALLVLGPFSQHFSLALGLVVAGTFSIVGVFLYLPALRKERAAA